MEAQGLVITLPAWVKLLLPILSPVIVAILRATLTQIKDKIPAWAWPVLSAAVGAMLTALGIAWDPSEILAGAVAGLAGAKARDLAVGRPETLPGQ
jgi:hypothetical protein